MHEMLGTTFAGQVGRDRVLLSRSVRAGCRQGGKAGDKQQCQAQRRAFSPQCGPTDRRRRPGVKLGSHGA
jgi:hypothetical protein